MGFRVFGFRVSRLGFLSLGFGVLGFRVFLVEDLGLLDETFCV